LWGVSRTILRIRIWKSILVNTEMWQVLNKWSTKQLEESVDLALWNLMTMTQWTSSCNSLGTRSTANELTSRKPSAKMNLTKWVAVVVVVDSGEEDKPHGVEIRDMEEALEVDLAEAMEVEMDTEVPTTGEEITPGKEVVEAGVIKEAITGMEVVAVGAVTWPPEVGGAVATEVATLVELEEPWGTPWWEEVETAVLPTLLEDEVVALDVAVVVELEPVEEDSTKHSHLNDNQLHHHEHFGLFQENTKKWKRSIVRIRLF
jgi:hypothetical protein